MSQILTSLCSLILKDDFGNVVETVGSFLLCNPPSPLLVIRQKLDAKIEIVSCLLSNIEHTSSARKIPASYTVLEYRPIVFCNDVPKPYVFSSWSFVPQIEALFGLQTRLVWTLSRLSHFMFVRMWFYGKTINLLLGEKHYFSLERCYFENDWNS